MWRGGSGSLTKQLYRKDVEGREERRRQRKRVKRGQGPGRAPLPPRHPPRPCWHSPFWGGGGGRTVGPPWCPPPPWLAARVSHLGCPPWPGVPWRDWWGYPPPGDPPLTFSSLFLELEGVGGFFLDLVAGSLVLWGHRSAVRGDPPQLTGAAPPGQIQLGPAVPFAWSLSSWLAVFFQSSILSCKGFIRLSMRALEQGERGGECGRALEMG